MDPTNQNLNKLIKNDIENAKMVEQNKNHIQYAILEAKKDFDQAGSSGHGMDEVQLRLAEAMDTNRQDYGPREGFGSIKRYLAEDKQVLEKFFIQAKMFDPRF